MKERGREAENPHEIPKLGWKDILKRSYQGFSDNNTSVAAAGIAFYAFTSVPALLTALVSIYGLVADPNQVQAQINSLSGVVPGQGLAVIAGQMRNVASHSGGALTLALVISSAFGLYSASSAIKALMTSLNLMYGEQERRGFFKYNMTAITLTLGGIVLAALAIVLVVGITGFIDHVHILPFLKTIVSIVRWPVLALFVMVSLAVVYRFGTSRESPKWRWVSWGAILATALWLCASALFSWYAGSFGGYNKTYGSLSAIIVLLMWFYITASVILLGAKINAEMEHQTDRDTTTGAPRPMGERGAKMADTRGEAA